MKLKEILNKAYPRLEEHDKDCNCGCDYLREANAIIDEIGELEVSICEYDMAKLFSDIRYECLGVPGMSQGKLSDLQAEAVSKNLPTLLSVRKD